MKKGILTRIWNHKKKEIERKKKEEPIFQLLPEIIAVPPFFKKVLLKKEISLIAEIKKKSPSAGVFRADFDPVRQAQSYHQAGADALSVLVDARFFGGSSQHIRMIKQTIPLPVLYKEFVLDPYQIYEAKLVGADCILLIAKMLPSSTLKKFLSICQKVNLEALVEVHNEEDLKKTLATPAEIIGINNRDLTTFKTDLETTLKLIKKIPTGKIIISESGIKTRADVLRLKQAGVAGILVGEALMKSENLTQKITELKLK